jgi:predicted nucleic acid-binding protein
VRSAECLPVPARQTGGMRLPVIRDRADQMFLTLAVAGKAEALVTGDNDLLVIKDSFKTPPIMTLSEFEQWHVNAK